MRKLALVAAALLSLAGCSSFDEAPSDDEEAPPVADGEWQGFLAKTNPSDFGGGEYCRYQIAFENVNVQITIENGEATKATVSARAIENVKSSPCSYDATAPSTHVYTSDEITIDGTGATTIKLVGAKSNKTAASLLIEGNFKQGSSGVKLHWHRTDQYAPLDWTDRTIVGVKTSG